VKVIRGPSHAPNVTAAVREMSFRVGPLPLPTKLGSPVRFLEIWLVDKNGPVPARRADRRAGLRLLRFG